MSNNTSIYKGSKHVFTNNSREGYVDIVAGPQETLRIAGTTSTANNLELIADLYLTDTSDNVQTYQRTSIGDKCAIGNNWFVSNAGYEMSIYGKSGTSWYYHSTIDPSLTTSTSDIDVLDIYDSSGTPVIASAQASANSIISFSEFNGSSWVAASYAGDYDFVSSESVRGIALMENTCYCICDNDKNVYKSVRVAGVWQKFTAVNFASFGYPNEIKCNGSNRICITYVSESRLRFFDTDLNLLQTYFDFVGESGFSKSIDFYDHWLICCADKMVYVFDNLTSWLFGTQTGNTISYYTVAETIDTVRIDRKEGKYAIIQGAANKQYFITRNTSTNIWIKESTSDPFRIMTFDSSYPTKLNSGAYGSFYMTGASALDTVYIKPLLNYSGTTTVAKISLDTTDYSVDFTSINEINMTVKDQVKVKVDSDSVDFKEKLVLNQSPNNYEVALQNNLIDQASITINDIDKLRINPNEVVAEVPLRIQKGTTSNAGLSFESDSNTGIMQSTADTLSVVAGGVNVADITMAAINSNKPISMPQSSSGFPTYTFQGDTDTGMYQTDTGKIHFSSNSTEFLKMGGGAAVFTNTILSLQTGHLSLSRNVNTTTGPYTVLSSGVYSFYGGVPNSSTWQSIITLPNSGGAQILLMVITGTADSITCQCVCHIYVNSSGGLTRTNFLLTGSNDNVNISGRDIQFRDYAGAYSTYNCTFMASIP